MRKILTKSLYDILTQYSFDIYECNGFIYHRDYDRMLTPIMRNRLGTVVDLVIDCRDQYGCVWQSWMIEKEIL
jgi:hypothetical protein